MVAVLVFPQRIWADSADYHQIALNLLAGNGFSMAVAPPFEPTMYREPLYPLFLAIAYALPGPDMLVARILQVVLGALTCLLVYRIASALTSDLRVSVLAGLLIAIHPAAAVYTGHILSETLAAFVLTWGVLLFIRGWQQHSSKYFAAAGIVLGAAALCKNVMLLFPLVLAAAFVASGLNSARGTGAPAPRKASFFQSAVLVGAFLLTLAPWSARNRVLFETGNISVRGGMVLWARAQTPAMSEEAAQSAMHNYFRQLRSAGESERAADAKMAQEGLALIRSNPGTYLSGNLGHGLDLWICSGSSKLVYSQHSSGLRGCAVDGLRLAGPLAFTALFSLMLAGGIIWLFPLGPSVVPLLTVLYLTVVHSFFALNSCRYGTVVVPIGMLLIARALVSLRDSPLWSRIVRRGERSA